LGISAIAKVQTREACKGEAQSQSLLLFEDDRTGIARGEDCARPRGTDAEGRVPIHLGHGRPAPSREIRDNLWCPRKLDSGLDEDPPPTLTALDAIAVVSRAQKPPEPFDDACMTGPRTGLNEQLTVDDLARHVFRKSAKLGPQLFVGAAGLLRGGHGLTAYHGR